MPTSTRSPSSSSSSTPCAARLFLNVLCVAAIAAAQNIAPTNTSSPNLTTVDSDLIGLQVTRADGLPVSATPTLLPLIDPAEAAVHLPDTGRTGSLFNATSDHVGDITSMSVAWISCDPSDYANDSSPVNVLQQAVDNNAAAALLYSRFSNYCNYTAGPKINSNFTFLYSMTSARGSRDFFNMLQFNPEGAPMRATINLVQRLADQSNGTGNGQNNDTPQPGGPSPSTAVAMIILYSITGVITALFLIIIITGAIRAHRHPERYGPRAVLGRTRQSRAKGLARAMLDSIPIVKFGEEDDDSSKHDGDVEMAASGSSGQRQSGENEGSTSREGAEERRSAEAAAGQSTPRESEDGIGRGIATPPRPANQLDESLGCSICTEDFERGEDVRLLPCNHKFHPACIDPWLLNVSGTCPLCRIDLRPPTSGDPDDQNPDSDSFAERSGSADASTGNGSLQPGDPRRQSRRLSSFFHNPLNRQRMQEASPEERIEALRQYNAQQQERAGRPDDSRRRRISAHLSGIFTGGRRRDEEGSAEGSRSGSPNADIPVEPPALSPLSFEQRHHESMTMPISPVPESDAIDHAPAILVHPPEAEKGKARDETA